METSLSIIFANQETSEDLPTIKIEVDDWQVTATKISYSNFYRFTGSRYVQLSESPFDLAYMTPPSQDCGISGGSIFTNIYIYRSNLTMAYTLHTSYGTLGSLSEKTSETIIYEETVNFNITDSHTLNYNSVGSVNGEWIGTVYDSEGEVVSPPSFSIKDGELKLSQKIYGSLKLTYAVIRDKYVLQVTAYKEENAALFDGVVYAIYTGGISWEIISSPPSITSLLIDGSVDCGWQWSQVIWVLDDDEDAEEYVPPEAEKVDIEVTYDYCSGLPINVDKSYGGIEG